MKKILIKEILNKKLRYKENGGFGPLKNENSERTISLKKNTKCSFGIKIDKKKYPSILI